MSTKKSKSFNAELDDLLADIDLPSEDEIKKETTYLKISQSRKGQESNHKGKERSFKGKARINKSVHSHSQETKTLISNKKLGKPSHRKGAVTPKEVIEKLCKKIQTPDGIFKSRNEAAAFYNIKPATLSFRLKKYPDQYFYI